LLLALGGCTRTYYRNYADSDVYGILRERLFDWRWRLPDRPVDADPHSRIGDGNDPNSVPIVPDDFAARQFQVSSRFPFEFHGWKRRGVTPIEDLGWQKSIPVEDDGRVQLSKDSIMRLGIANSRNYQFQYENLYLAALSLTLARFQFMVQGFSNWGVFYSPLGAGGVVFNNPTTTVGTDTTSPFVNSIAAANATTAGTSGTTAGTSAATGGGTGAVPALAGSRTGAKPNPSRFNNQLQVVGNNGFFLQLMTGAQLMVNLANSLVFEYSNHGVQLASPSLTINFIQPLLRGAWARVVTQQLSLQERGVLYALRSFAEYRRQFYVGLVTGSGSNSGFGYLSLLFQLQAIRNAESNLRSYRRNLDIYEEELKSGFRTVLERDQLAQQYQTNQFNLLQFQAGLQTALDQFKLLDLALPPEQEVRLDDSPLDQFELNDPRLEDLRNKAEALFLKLLQNEELPRDALSAAAAELGTSLEELGRVHDRAVAELAAWLVRLDARRKAGFSGADAQHDQEIYERERRLSGEIRNVLSDTDSAIGQNRDALATFRAKLPGMAPGEATQALRRLVGREFRARLSEVAVAQTQIRVFAIELPPVDLTVNQAVQVALGNRLDLQNALALVTDNWRDVEVDANQLRGFLNFVYNGQLNSAPAHGTLFRFDARSSLQTFGLEFDAPINRRVERNQYRADQINYQRARRNYMQTRDTVVQQARFDMRQLALTRRQFEINREQLIISSRQLEQAEYDVRTGGDPASGGQSLTLYLLNALQAVLNNRNSLIQTWVSYETARMSLYRDFDLMDIDAFGVWTNENDPTVVRIALEQARTTPALSLAVPAGIPDLSPGVGSGSNFYVDVEPGGRVNRVPDAARDRFDEGPLTPSEIRRQPGVDGGVPIIPPVPAGPGPFAPDRPSR
jgi:outer membrane protein TolC